MAAKGCDVRWYDPAFGLYDSGVDAQLVMVCVPTPMGREGLVTKAVYQVADWFTNAGVTCPIAIRSTVPVGTCDTLRRTYPRAGFFSWPEFLRAARADEDAAEPQYAVVGLPDGWLHEEAGMDWLAPLLPTGRIILTTPATAEFIKLATNALLATAVGIANELSELADGMRAAGLDISPGAWNDLLPQIAQWDANMPHNIMVTPERGYGGACLPKDVHGLLQAAHWWEVETPVLRAVEVANHERRPQEYRAVFDE